MSKKNYIETLRAQLHKRGRVVKSVNFGEEDIDLLLWAMSQPWDFSSLCKEALRLLKDQGEDQPATPEIDYTHIRAIIRQELAGVSLSATPVPAKPTPEEDPELLNTLMELF